MNAARDHRRRTLVPALTRLLIMIVTLFLGASMAGPAYPIDDPTIGPPRKEALPVQITIDSISPSVGTAADGAPQSLTVKATVTNKGDTTVDSLWARLQRDSRVASRAALDSLDADQPTFSGAQGPDTDFDFTLEPGATHSLELTATFEELGIADDGTFPVLVNLNGEIDGDPQRVGQAAIYLPYAATIAGQVQASWVWPLIDRPHQSATPDVFIDDELASLVDKNGRLDILLSAAEKHGPAANLTLMVDPALVAELAAMSDGYSYRNADGNVVEGKGADAATAFLDRLTELAAKVQVATTSYADMDTVALVRGGLGNLVAESRHFGTDIVEQVLNTTTVSDLDWPADGAITSDALGIEDAAGVSRLLLGGAAFGQPRFLSSNDNVTESAATTMPGTGTAIVADPALTRIIGEGPSYAAGPVAATQRLTAELFTIVQEAPNRTRNVVLTPPRTWAPSADYANALLDLTTSTPWISPISMDEVISAPAVDRGELIYPPEISQSELPASEVGKIPGVLAAITTLSAAFSKDDVDEILGQPKAAVYQAASVAHRDNPAAVGHTLDDISNHLAEIRGGIYIVPPSDGTYTLSSTEAPLVFTVENTLPVTVRYKVRLDEGRSSGLSAQDGGVLEIGPNQRATVQLDTKVQRSGSFSVVAQIVTPDGQPLGADVLIRVNSSAYGTVALLVTGAAFLLLLLLIGRRAFKRHRFRQEQRALLATDIAPHHVTMDEAAISSSWLDEPVDDAPDPAPARDPAPEPEPDPGSDSDGPSGPDDSHSPDGDER